MRRRIGFAAILETVLSKGIRVNQLAKELGVESKLILTKCREEGLSDRVTNHMSVLSLGLAETVREWFTHSGGLGGVSTAIETAAPVDVLTKPRTRKAPAKKKTATDTDEIAPPPPEITDEA